MCTPATISLRYGPSPFGLVCLALSPSPLLVRPSFNRSFTPPPLSSFLPFCTSEFAFPPPPSFVGVDTFPLRRVVLVQDRWLRDDRGGMGREKWPEEEDTDEDNCLIVNPRSRSTRFANLRVTLPSNRPPRRALSPLYLPRSSDFAFEINREPERASEPSPEIHSR